MHVISLWLHLGFVLLVIFADTMGFITFSKSHYSPFTFSNKHHSPKFKKPVCVWFLLKISQPKTGFLPPRGSVTSSASTATWWRRCFASTLKFHHPSLPKKRSSPWKITICSFRKYIDSNDWVSIQSSFSSFRGCRYPTFRQNLKPQILLLTIIIAIHS